MKLFHFLLAAVVATTACSSSNNDEPDNGAKITVNPKSITAPCTKSTATLTVQCDREWTAYSDQDWIKCVKERDNATVTVTVAENLAEAARTGKVTVKAGTTLANVDVTQEARPADPVDETIKTPEGYKLVWHDEFDEGTVPGGDWWYETGAGGWGNNEIQNYVSCKTPSGEALASIKNGILTITCKKEGNQVYSIRMNTSKSWTYGWFEARLRLPKGKGTWPAFWMMPKNFTAWPDDGEIDIMEEVGYNPNRVSSSIHCKSYNHSIGTQKTREILVPNAQDEFHVYALEWTKDVIRTYVDGKLLFTFENDGKGNKSTWPFFNPFYLKLNLAWGGNWGGAQGIDEGCLPATYEIDYVRVFQPK